MQKKLIALAVAGLASSAAFAQSNVQIYGLLDLGYRVGTASGKQTTNGIASASSNLWGLKGTEDLGNGMKAGFVLEGGLATDTGDAATGGKLFGRQSYLSLSGGFGTVLVGRFNTLGRAYVIKFAPSPYSAVDTASNLATATGFTIAGNGADTINTGARVSNAVAYVLPTLVDGVTLTAAHAFHESPLNTAGFGGAGATNQSFSVNELSAGYDKNGLALAYVYHNVGAISGGAANAVALGTIQEHFFGGSYDFGAVKLMGSYQTREVDNAILGSAGSKDKVYQIGASAPLTAKDTVTLSWSKLDLGNNLQGLAGGTVANLGSTTTTWNDATGWAASYKHDLSKRTNMYVAYSRIKNSGTGTLSLGATSAPTAGGSSSSFIAGMQHSF